MVLALPKFRWLVLGAIAAGVWVVREDFSGPRPPQRVPTWIERVVAPNPQPSKPAAATAKVDRLTAAKPVVKVVTEKPVPPKPVTGRSAPQRAVTQRADPRNTAPQRTALQKTAPQKTALLLPKSIDRPPAKPEKIVTGSIIRPDKPTFVQTRAKVFMRAQAKADAPIIATLRPRIVMRELARSGEWRLVMGDGQKGWVRADYLMKPTFLPRRPKLPLAEVKQAKAPAKPAKAQ